MLTHCAEKRKRYEASAALPSFFAAKGQKPRSLPAGGKHEFGKSFERVVLSAVCIRQQIEITIRDFAHTQIFGNAERAALVVILRMQRTFCFVAGAERTVSFFRHFSPICAFRTDITVFIRRSALFSEFRR